VIDVRSDLALSLADRPGSMADLLTALAEAGIDLLGICGVVDRGIDVDHILVADPDAAAVAASAAGAVVRGRRGVIVISQPVSMASALRSIADVGVAVDLVYTAFDGAAVLGVTDLTRARLALTGSGAVERNPRPPSP
jgi:hypothetical protein